MNKIASVLGGNLHHAEGTGLQQIDPATPFLSILPRESSMGAQPNMYKAVGCSIIYNNEILEATHMYVN